MKKISSALKWLAEKRARTTGDLAHMEELLIEVQSRVTKLSGELAALDGTLGIYDLTIEAESIEPVHAWKDRYGPRGAFKKAVVAMLRQHAPEAISTEVLTLEMILQFDLRFPLLKLRQEWSTNSLRPMLKGLIRDGLVERMHDPHAKKLGYWRWRQDEQPTLADLRTKATARAIKS